MSLRLWWAHLLVPTAIILLGLALIEWQQWDFKVMAWFFDASSQSFPLRQNQTFEALCHGLSKYLLIVVAVVLLALLVASYKVPTLARHRRPISYVLLAMLLSNLLISQLKAVTNVPCPWDLQLYGGQLPYWGVFDARPAEINGLRCWPAGHAGGGLSLLALYWLGRCYSRNWAYLAGSLALVYGGFQGISRMAQGAHFVSHNLWSLLLCWWVACWLARWFRLDQPKPN